MQLGRVSGKVEFPTEVLITVPSSISAQAPNDQTLAEIRKYAHIS